MAEVEETFKRIQNHKGVLGILVIDKQGNPIKTTMDQTTTTQYAAQMSNLAAVARSAVRDIDPTNDLSFLRVRSKKHEIMIAPDKDFMLVVVQNPEQ